MKRRSVVLGLGTLAVGSGATLTSASFSGTADSEGAGMQVVSAADVNLAPGESHNDSMGDLTPGDLPAANVSDGSGDASISIDLVTRIDASGASFDELFTINNESTDDIEVHIDFTDVNTFSNTDATILKEDIVNAYDFEIGDQNPQPIAGTDGSGNDNTVMVNSGTTESVDLTVDFEGAGLVSDLRQALNDKGNGPGGNPFNGDVGSATSLVNKITIHADSDN